MFGPSEEKLEKIVKAEVDRQLGEEAGKYGDLHNTFIKGVMDMNENISRFKETMLGSDDGRISAFYGVSESEFRKMMSTRIRRMVHVELKKVIDNAIESHVVSMGLFEEHFIDSVVERIRKKQITLNG